PIVLRWLAVEPGSDRRAVVVVDEAVDGHPSGLPRGAIVTRIGSEAVEEIAEQAAAGVRERGGRANEVAFMVARAVGSMLSCPAGGSKSIEFLDPSSGDAATELEVACFVPEGERMSL